jgi:SAM-dependent methyltransferase
MSSKKVDKNVDQKVIDSFGQEWATFKYVDPASDAALDEQFLAYCEPIDLSQFNSRTSVAADFGAGSGRWTSRLLPYFSLVYALEPSDGASTTLREKFSSEPRVKILQETLGANSIPNESLDLAVSLGVLHHIPNTALAIKEVSCAIKPGGLFLCYLYYSLENKPLYYKVLFSCVNVIRKITANLPHPFKRIFSEIISVFVYWPLARTSYVLSKFGFNTANFPLHHYAKMPLVMMKNDSLDRFGTSLEQRFTKSQIVDMLKMANFDLDSLQFSNIEPFWTFTVKKNTIQE